MTTFRSFDPVAPISDETIARYAGQVPPGVAEAWRNYGAGTVGADGFFRFVDPAHAGAMLAPLLELPEGSTVLFSTALGDLIVFANDFYLVIKSRWGAIDYLEHITFDALVALIEDPAQRQSAWEWEPFPAARARDGVPGFEECFGFTLLLSLGGPNDVSNLRRVGLWEHLSTVMQLAGGPAVRRPIEIAESQTTDASGAAVHAAGTRDRLVEVGRALFAKLTQNPKLDIVDLPDGLGVCLVHQARGGGKIYVAPDESALFVGSSVDFEAGLGAFRDGVRTPPEKFELNGGAR